jgi:hypothetical protein
MSPASHPKRAVSGVVVPEAARWHGRLAARLIATLARLLASSLRWHWTDHSFFNDTSTDQRAIFAPRCAGASSYASVCVTCHAK